MSSGVFQRVNYESNTLGTEHPVRVQPETLAITIGATPNAAPAGTAVLPSAQVSQSRRALGINARTLTFKFPEASVPAGYKADSPISVPWLQNNAAFLTAVPGITAVTAYGAAAILVSVTPEKVN